jgi:hypothetical protein
MISPRVPIGRYRCAQQAIVEGFAASPDGSTLSQNAENYRGLHIFAQLPGYLQGRIPKSPPRAGQHGPEEAMSWANGRIEFSRDVGREAIEYLFTVGGEWRRVNAVMP